MNEMSQALRSVLETSGWREGRSVPDKAVAAVEMMKAEGFSVVPGALEAVAELGGLNIGKNGKGRVVGRMAIAFDPELASGEQDRFADVEERLEIRLSPLGEVCGGEAFLALGDDRALYFLSSDIWRAGDTLEQGLEAILTGLPVQKLDR